MMQIALAKKLADRMKLKAEPAQTKIDPSFVLTVNWGKVWANQQANDMLVVVNNATRFAMVVYQV